VLGVVCGFFRLYSTFTKTCRPTVRLMKSYYNVRVEADLIRRSVPISRRGP